MDDKNESTENICFATALLDVLSKSTTFEKLANNESVLLGFDAAAVIQKIGYKFDKSSGSDVVDFFNKLTYYIYEKIPNELSKHMAFNILKCCSCSSSINDIEVRVLFSFSSNLREELELFVRKKQESCWCFSCAKDHECDVIVSIPSLIAILLESKEDVVGELSILNRKYRCLGSVWYGNGHYYCGSKIDEEDVMRMIFFEK